MKPFRKKRTPDDLKVKFLFKLHYIYNETVFIIIIK